MLAETPHPITREDIEKHLDPFRRARFDPRACLKAVKLGELFLDIADKNSLQAHTDKDSRTFVGVVNEPLVSLRFCVIHQDNIGNGSVPNAASFELREGAREFPQSTRVTRFAGDTSSRFLLSVDKRGIVDYKLHFLNGRDPLFPEWMMAHFMPRILEITRPNP